MLRWLIIALSAASASGALAATVEHHTFRGQSYSLTTPDHGGPVGVLLYLHGFRAQGVDAQSRDTLARWIGEYAEQRNMAALIPQARQRDCVFGGQVFPGSHCWAVEENGPIGDWRRLRALIAHVENELGLAFTHKEIVGYSNGAFFASMLFQRNELGEYRRMGLLAGGGLSNPHRRLRSPTPEVYLEIARNDPANNEEIARFVDWLGATDIDAERVHMRIVDGEHAYDEVRYRAFWRWYHGLDDVAAE